MTHRPTRIAHAPARRDWLRRTGAGLAGLALMEFAELARAFPSRPGEEALAWLDQPPANPSGGVVENLQPWEDLGAWITPTDKFFRVAHYDKPMIDAKDWRLDVGGLVRKPMRLDLAALQARRKQQIVYTLECSGNHGFPWFQSGIGTARWGGTSLAALLKEAGVRKEGTEVVFFGADAGEETVREVKMKQNFARSMSVADAMDPNLLLCWEMNGARLVAPGWYGIANVKWLQRIEVRDSRFMGRFMARDYVTLREEPREGGGSVWTESSVGRTLLKSVPAKVTRQGGQHRIVGAAWGAPVARVEVQVDSGAWRAATIDRGDSAPFAWKVWSIDWPDAAPGEHAITSRAIDTQGNVQPAMDSPRIATKRTYWESNGQVTRRLRIA
jgi:DMSO/TMAO reductase YedYZ molybdopterin-dependent catalytic subunit